MMLWTLMDFLNGATTSLFRWESLQYYADDANVLAFFKATGDIERESMKEWWSFIAEKKQEGIVLQRVRLVAEPVNDYTKMELAIHKESNKRGDNIKIITEEKYKQIGKTMPDFWLVDDKTVLIMRYDAGGKYEGFGVEQSIEEFLFFKELLLKDSQQL